MPFSQQQKRRESSLPHLSTNEYAAKDGIDKGEHSPRNRIPRHKAENTK